MTNQPPKLTDTEALAFHRARIRGTDALFLQQEAADEIEERLNEVNRTFTNPAIVTAFPQIWEKILPNAKIVPDQELLSLEVDSHDLVIHAMGLHWANDLVGQLVQCRRALRADGLFIGAMFGGQTLSELRTVWAEVETKLTGGLSPRVAPMAEIRELGALLQRAGFALPVADSVTKKVTYRDAQHLMRDLREMGETNALAQRLKRPVSRTVLAAVNDTYAQHFTAESGRIRATFELVFLTGWAPDESQQKPLRPGSAQARLADALNTTELKLPEKTPKS
ncbi:SAM-dependent methyltransferase [Falsihalocynthiibacter sp. SS001]|uniref:SAM-dependent methyltransferase n=1 Tax=Falsihalocynthiibacter sp. SS001 TaxID=3349698 RepID=UPI0036D3EAFC